MVEIFISLILIIFIILSFLYPRYQKKKYYENLQTEVPKILKKLITKYKKNQKIALNNNKYKGDHPNLTFPPFKYILILWAILGLITIFILNWNLYVVLIIFVIVPLILYLYLRYRSLYVSDLVIKNNRLIIYLDDEVLNEFKLEDLNLKIKLNKELNNHKDYKMYLKLDKTYKLKAEYEMCDQSFLIAFIILIHLVNTKQIDKIDLKSIDIRDMLKEIERFNLSHILS